MESVKFPVKFQAFFLIKMKIELVKTLPKKIDNFNNALARFSITLAPIFIGNERNGIMEYLNNFDQRFIFLVNFKIKFVFI